MVNPDMLPGSGVDEKSESQVRNAEPKKDKKTEAAPDAKKTVSVKPIAQPAARQPAAQEDQPSEESVIAEYQRASESQRQEPAREPSKPNAKLQGLDLNELLNEIRSIGSNV